MSAFVQPVFANPDPSANPTSVADLVTLLNNLAEQVNVQGGPFTPYVISSTTPQVSDQDKIWAKTDGNGRPLGQFLFYNGNWRRFYNGKTGEKAYFDGNPATYFDNTGLGLIGLDWDGWALCNGQNGTPNLSNLFIANGGMDNAGITGYSGGHWNTNMGGGASQTGGAASYALINNNLPYMPVFVNGYKYSAGAAQGIKHIHCDGDWSSPNNPDPTLQTAFGADTTGQNGPPVPQVPVPTLPPYYTMAIAGWVGYT